MKTLKILSTLFLFFLFSENLKSMRKSDEEFFKEKEKAFTLLKQIKEYKETNNSRIEKLKETMGSINPDFLNLYLILEDNIKKKNLKNLEILIQTPELFLAKIMNSENNVNYPIQDEDQFKKLMHWLLFHAAYCNQNQSHAFCMNYICQKYEEAFGTTIFSRDLKDNDRSLKMLFVENKLDSIKILIEQNILDWVQDKETLNLFASEKELTEMQSILAQKIEAEKEQLAQIKKIEADRKKFCPDIFLITSGLAALVLLPPFFC
jgi:hypothetical protein